MSDVSKLLGIGHSHLSAVIRAYRAEFAGEGWNFAFAPLRLQTAQIGPNIIEENGHRTLTDDVVRRVKHVTRRIEPDAICGFFMGNEVNALAMVNHERPFDFHWPEMEMPAMDGVEVIPFGLMKQQMRHLYQRNAGLFCAAVRKEYDGRILIVPPPPPNPSEQHIRSHPGKFGQLIRRHGLAPASVRLKMWMLYCEVLREEAAQSGAEVFNIPTNAFDQNGFFAETFWNNDPTHGNVTYGRLVLTSLLEKLFSLAPERIPA